MSVRTIVRYMAGKPAAQQQQQQRQEQTQQEQGSPGQESMATGSAAVKSAASAEQALLKIASATVQKLPKLQGRQITVKTSMTYIKKFATAKKFAWEPTGLYEAVTAIRKGAGQAYGDLVDQGRHC